MTFSGERERTHRQRPRWTRETKRKVKLVKPAPMTFRRRRELREARRAA